MIRKFFTSATLIFLVSLIYAQEVNYSVIPVADYRKPQKYIIKDISVSGIKYLDKGILVNLSGLMIGQTIQIPGEQITKSIEKLWDQGLFSDVKITTTSIENDSISLDIFLQERLRLSDFKIIGVKKSEAEDLKEKLEMKRGKQITDNIINNSKRVIRDYLYNKKYLNAEIDMVLVDDTLTKMNNAILNVYIKKNDKVKIKEIVIEGNEVFSDRKLNRYMKNTNKKDWNIFKNSKFVEEDYKEDKDKIITKYNSKGYRDARIVKDSVYVINKKRIGIHLEIDEGNQYFFRNIDWVGNTKYSSEALDKMLKIKKGDPYNTELLEERLNIDEDAVSNLYLDFGHLFFNLTPVISRVENDSIDLQMRITEGERVTLNRVIIKGNTKTNEHVARRELRTNPGDLFSKADIIRSQRELAQLGHFDPETFGIEPININQAEATVDLEYSLNEKPNDQLEIAGGWGAGMLIGTVGIRFSNFAIGRVFEKKAWRPIPTGDGQSLSIRLQTNGSYYSAYSLSFVEPWLGGKRANSLSFSIYHTVRSNASYLYGNADQYFKITGVSVGLGKRLKWPDDYFTLSNTISYQRYYLEDWTTNFIIDNGTSNNINLSTTFARNSTDAPIFPRRGSSFALSLQLTPPYSLFKKNKWWELSTEEIENVKNDLKEQYVDTWDDVSTETQDKVVANAVKDKENGMQYNWIEYHKWNFKSNWYMQLVGNLVLATDVEFGYLGYYNKDWGYSPFGSFDLGGDGMSGYNLYGIETVALRGYTNGSLTPYRNVDGVGQESGNIYQKMYLELRYPITLKPQATIYVLGFLEAGNAWYSFDDYDPFNIKRSVGVGLRAFLPMFGLLGIDWGYGFDEINSYSGDNGSQFHFVIGQQF